jgi:hypothetical protein
VRDDRISSARGGFGGVMALCSMGMDGQGTISDGGRTMTGTYSGNLSGQQGLMGHMTEHMQAGRDPMAMCPMMKPMSGMMK